MIENIRKDLEGRDTLSQLQYMSEKFEGKIVFSTSFQYEDQVIVDMIFRNELPIEVFTLDTGRHFPETYKAIDSTREKYNKPIKIFFPPTTEVEKLMIEKGAFSFYQSLENRKECCYIRKVIPLQRALSGNQCWVTGLRAGQSGNRTDMSPIEYDNNNNIFKFNPLINWTIEEVKTYILRYNVPYISLHDRNYPSIGCQPCTRAIREGEDVRAGRWWWETNSKKECGLHAK